MNIFRASNYNVFNSYGAYKRKEKTASGIKMHEESCH